MVIENPRGDFQSPNRCRMRSSDASNIASRLPKKSGTEKYGMSYIPRNSTKNMATTIIMAKAIYFTVIFLPENVQPAGE